MTDKQSAKRVRSPICGWLRFAVLWLLGNLALVGVASADIPDVSPDDLLRKGRAPDDFSHQLFSQILGPFWDNPLAAVMDDSVGLVASVFLIFNAAVFTIGVLWASWGVVSGIVETADSGEVLGRRQSTVWMPIRMGWGFAQIVPIFGGYSLAQVLIVLSASMGIGLANMMFGAAMEAGDNGLIFPNASASTTTSPLSMEKAQRITDALFKSQVCMRLVTDARAVRGDNVARPASDPIGRSGVNYGGFAFHVWAGPDSTLPDYPAACGMYRVEFKEEQARDADGVVAALSYRTNAVNYKAIASGVAAAYLQTLSQQSLWASREASGWLAARRAAMSAGATPPPYPRQAIEQAAGAMMTRVSQAMTAFNDASRRLGTDGAINGAVKQRMLANGWLSAGVWTQTFMEINAAHADAINAVSVHPIELKLEQVRAAYPDAAERLEHSLVSAQRRDADDPTAPNHAPDTVDPCGALVPDAFGNDAGNCSMGQYIVRKIIAGGAENGGGAGLINPLISFKNLGDYFMTIGSAVWTAGAVGQVGGGVAQGVIPGPVSKLAAGLVEKLGAGVASLGVFLLVLGMAMALYIPSIPFIVWMGAVTQYAVVVFQGLAGASLAGLAHLDAEGDGLGQRTNAWYMLLLSVTFRPALMLLGFFVAMALMIGLATIQFKLFGPAMANIQGNSITGIASIIGLVALFFLLNWTLIQGLFNMIFLFADQILGLVGTGNPNAELGKETEGRMSGAFMVLRQRVEGMVPRPRAAPAPASTEGKGGKKVPSSPVAP